MMDKCQNCKYFSRDDSVGMYDCLKMDFLTSLEIEHFVNAETQSCSQFEAYDGEAEDRYYAELSEEMGGFLNE